MQRKTLSSGRNVELPVDANILSTTNTQSFINYVNPDFVAISGYSADELIGQPHNIVRHPDMPATAFEHMWATLKAVAHGWAGEEPLQEWRLYYWVSAYVTPISQNGNIVEYQSVRTRPQPEHPWRPPSGFMSKSGADASPGAKRVLRSKSVTMTWPSRPSASAVPPACWPCRLRTPWCWLPPAQS